MLFSANKNPVLPVSLGGAGIGSCSEKVFFNGPVSEKQAVETVLYALENGINLIDSSPFYGNSEHKTGIAIREFGKRDSYIVSTKAGTHPSLGGYSSDDFHRSIENSLKELYTDYLDIVHIHDPSDDNFKKVMASGGGMETLLRLKEENVIRHIGLGVRSHKLHREFISSGFADVILPYLDYNVLTTSAAGLLDYAMENGVSVMMGSPLVMGLLSGKDPVNYKGSHFDISGEFSAVRAKRMFDWCKIRNINLAAVNMKFILSNPAVTTIVAGAVNAGEVKESLRHYFEPVSEAILNSFMEEFEIKKTILPNK